MATAPNGDPALRALVDNAAIAARLDVLLGKIDACTDESRAAREEAKAARTAAERVANDQFELRTGVPSSWRRRLILVTIAAAIGAMSGAVASNATAMAKSGGAERAIK
jgi:hypothetical protein